MVRMLDSSSILGCGIMHKHRTPLLLFFLLFLLLATLVFVAVADELDPFSSPEHLDESSVAHAESVEQITIILDNRPDLIMHLSASQLQRYGMSRITRDQLSYAAPEALTDMDASHASAYFSAEGHHLPRSDLHENEILLYQLMYPGLSLSDDLVGLYDVVYDDGRVTYEGTTFDFGDAAIYLDVHDGFLTDGTVVVRSGSVRLIHGGYALSDGAEVHTPHGVVSTGPLPATLYLEHSALGCAQCVVLDAHTQQLYIDGDGMTVQLSDVGYTLLPGTSVGTNTILDMDGSPTIVLIDGAVHFVPGSVSSLDGIVAISDGEITFEREYDFAAALFCPIGTSSITGAVTAGCITVGTYERSIFPIGHLYTAEFELNPEEIRALWTAEGRGAIDPEDYVFQRFVIDHADSATLTLELARSQNLRERDISSLVDDPITRRVSYAARPHRRDTSGVPALDTNAAWFRESKASFETFLRNLGGGQNRLDEGTTLVYGIEDGRGYSAVLPPGGVRSEENTVYLDHRYVREVIFYDYLHKGVNNVRDMPGELLKGIAP